MRHEVNLKATLNTSYEPEEIAPLADGPALRNTGIERDGGITNVQRDVSAAAFVAGDLGRGVSDSGRVVRIDANGIVYIDGRQVYSNPLATPVYPRHTVLSGDDDYCLDTADNLPIGVRGGRNIVIVTKYNVDGTVNATRNIAWAGISSYNMLISIVRSSTITYAALAQLVASSAAGITYYNAGATGAVPGTLTPPLKRPLYAYKYENANSYILWNCETELAIVGNIMGGAVGASFAVKRLAEDVNGGFSRHVITNQPILVGANINAVALIGHTTFAAAYSAVPVWQYPAGLNASAVSTTYRCAQGYVEAFYTDTVSGNPYWFGGYRFDSAFTPMMAQVPFCAVPVDYHGGLFPKLGSVFAYVEVIDGGGSFLSAYGSAIPAAGFAHDPVALTPVGSLDDTFVIPFLEVPFVAGVNQRAALIARDADGAMDYFNLEAAMFGLSANLIEKIGPEQFRANWLDPMQIIDCALGDMLYAASAYHNSMQPMYSVAPSSTLVSLTSRLEPPEFMSIDTGEKQYGDNYGWVNCWGLRPGMAARVYRASTYSASYAGIDIAAPFGLAPLVEQDQVGALYVPSELLPYPVPISRDEVGAWRAGFSCVLAEGFNEYQIGNDLPGRYEFFTLFGQRYALNEGRIYAFTLDQGGFIADVAEIAKADGLTLLTVAPTLAYFYSAWDNALYTFDGGQSVVKLARLTQFSPVTAGIFSTHENALYLDVGTKLLTQRDGVVTEIDKTAAQVALCLLFKTATGIRVADGTDVTRYRYSGGATTLALEWRSAYYGQQANQRGILTHIVYTLYSPTKSTMNVVVGVDQFDETDDYTQREYLQIAAQDWSDAGYFRIRLQPQVQRALGSSIYFQTASKVWLASVAINYEDDAQAVIPEGASK